MLNHIIGVQEAAELWGLSPGYVKNLCAQRKLVSKKVGKSWVIYKNQPHPSEQTQEDVAELAKSIEWQLLSREERLYILDENTRKFYNRVKTVKSMKQSGVSEVVIREVFEHLDEKEFNKIRETADTDEADW